MLKNNEYICPFCNKSMYLNLDCYGHTPWHLRCDWCDINIGVDKRDNLDKLLSFIDTKNTLIEFYNNDIQLMIKNNQIVINKEC